MANTTDPTSILNALYQSNQAQMAQLQQPSPQQGGFLSGADPIMLSLAAGLLSPTKTGGFGESIGLGLQSIQSPLAEMRRQEAAKADKLAALQSAQAKLAMDLYEVQTGGRRSRYEEPSMTAKRIIDIANGYKAEYENDPNSPSGKDAYKKFQFFKNKAEDILGYPVDFEENATSEETPAPAEEEQGWVDWAKEKVFGKEPEKTAAPKEKSKPEAKTVEEAPADDSQASGKTAAKPYTGEKPPANYPNAKKGKYGYWYVPVDPSDPSKGYQYVAE